MSTSPPVAWHGAVQAVAIQPDGKIVAAGTRRSLAATGGELALARYTPDGGADRSFGDAGVACASDAASGPAIAILDGGEILAGGKTLVRFDADGTIDRSFGSDGRVDTGFGSAFALQPDGAVVVGGAVDEPAPHIGWRFRLARYTPDGQRDSTFGKDGDGDRRLRIGSARSAPRDASDYIVGVLVAEDGSIVALGTASSCGMCDESRFAVARYAPGGRDRPSVRRRRRHHGGFLAVLRRHGGCAPAGRQDPAGRRLGRRRRHRAGPFQTPTAASTRASGRAARSMTHFRRRPAAAGAPARREDRPRGPPGSGLRRVRARPLRRERRPRPLLRDRRQGAHERLRRPRCVRARDPARREARRRRRERRRRLRARALLRTAVRTRASADDQVRNAGGGAA